MSDRPEMPDVPLTPLAQAPAAWAAVTDASRHHVGSDWVFGSLRFDAAFEGGRLDAVEETGEGFLLRIEPEATPINNSPWYAFRVASEEHRALRLQLDFGGATRASGEAITPRYVPKISRDGVHWESHSEALVDGGFDIEFERGVTWIAAQELYPLSRHAAWAEGLSAQDWVARNALPRETPHGNSIELIEIGGPDTPYALVVLGRQHAPEVPGVIAMERFIEAIAADTPEAAAFRAQVRTYVVPVANPDGVQAGHWRCGSVDMDLNRDWRDFRAAETRMIRDALLTHLEQREVLLAIDFHATWTDRFYPLGDIEEVDAFFDGYFDSLETAIEDAAISQEEVDPDLSEALSAFPVDVRPSGLGEGTARNWFYEALGAPAFTYEVGDETPRRLVRAVAAAAALATMETLLDSVPETPGSAAATFEVDS